MRIVNCWLVVFACAAWLPAQEQANPQKVLRLPAGVPVPADGGPLTNTVRIVPGPEGEERYAVADQYFDSLVFGGSTITQPKIRQQLDYELRARLHPTVMRFSLIDSQKEKLQLAGRGDIKNWIDRVDDLRSQMTAEPLTDTRFADLVRETRAVANDRNGLFGNDSLFYKTTMSTLNDEQRQRFADLENKRRRDVIYRALLRMPRGVGDAPVSDETLHRIALRVVEVFGDAPVPASQATYIYMLQAAELGDELGSLVPSVEEWKTLQKQIGIAQGDEARLRDLGIWPVKRRVNVE
jgi:hypothetical protein